MTEEVRLSPDGSYIRITSAGPPSLAEMEETLSQIVKLQRHHGIAKVLVDSRVRSGQPSVLDIFRGGQMLAKSLEPGTRVAVLVALRERDHSFFEDVASNRGALVAYFQLEELAIQWLLANGP
jgi:hypothetical protein